ncbi:MAG: hypothetical protein AXW12_11315 [Thalassospira sp. Nap_22]|nr:MAG: hypothetical protein AXW12_11315 [Thalassospira sp. Nap_22]
MCKFGLMVGYGRMHSARLARAVGGGWRMFGKIVGFSPEISLSDVARRSKRAYEHSLRIFWNPTRGRRAIWAAPDVRVGVGQAGVD